MAAAQHNEERDDSELFSQDEWRRIRARIHNLSDRMQGHALFLEQHRSDIKHLDEAVRELRLSMVNQPQHLALVNEVVEIRKDSATKGELTSVTTLLTLKLDAVLKAQEKTDNNLSKVMWIVLTAVIGAVLGMVILKGGAPKLAQIIDVFNAALLAQVVR